MDWNLLMIVYFGFLGLALGSFLNVCIYRIPIKKSIVTPRSACPQCGEKIRFYDNIPLLSYMILLGKCRHCKTRVSIQYPMVEVLTGLLSIALFIKFGLTYQYFLYLVFMSLLIVISVIDLYHKIIPDVLSLPGIAAGFLVSFLPRMPVPWLDSMIGLLVGGGTLFVVAVVYERITAREGMGGGDIKLLAMIGAWMGWRDLYLVVMLSSLIGTIVGVSFLVAAGKNFRFRIPFGPFLSLGAVLTFFFGKPMLAWYLNLL